MEASGGTEHARRLLLTLAMPTGRTRRRLTLAPGKVAVVVPPILLFLTALFVLAVIAIARVARFRSGREPLPSGWRAYSLALALLIIPPLVLQAIVNPAQARGDLGGFGSVILYIAFVAALWLLSRLSAPAIARLVPIDRRPLILLALTGREPSGAVAFDPPMTGAIADQVALVDARNADFPRGTAFMYQVDLPGFQSNWDALDAATRSLEEIDRRRRSPSPRGRGASIADSRRRAWPA